MDLLGELIGELLERLLEGMLGSNVSISGWRGGFKPNTLENGNATCYCAFETLKENFVKPMSDSTPQAALVRIAERIGTVRAFEQSRTPRDRIIGRWMICVWRVVLYSLFSSFYHVV